MDNPTKTRALELLNQHSKRVDEILSKYTLTKQDLTKAFMTGRLNELDSELVQEAYYLDAYAKLVNEENYVPVDKVDWRPKDYVDAMLPQLYTWLEDAYEYMEYFQKEGLVQGAAWETDTNIFQAVLIAALGWNMRKDDEREQREVAPATGTSSEPGTDNGS